MPSIISASRRSDIPRYFGRWFAARRREGFAEFRTVYGQSGRVSLASADVLAYAFWTRDARAFEPVLRELRADGTPFAFQFTINGYERDLEPHRPSLRCAIASFQAVAAMLPDERAIQWRYDPIILCDRMPAAYHARAFRELARELRGATRVVNVSIVEPYARAIRRIADPSVRFRTPDPERHRSVARRFPNLPRAEDAWPLLQDLVGIARDHAMELRVCSNPEYPLPRSQCISPELFAPYGLSIEPKPTPTRSACRCIRSTDIGMDNTCVAGCRYCYVTTSQQIAIANFRQHDPNRATLR